MNAFSNLTDQIPLAVLKQVQAYIGNAVAIFKPPVYIQNVKMVNHDYHFVLPSSDPPPTFIGKKEYGFKKNRMIVLNPDTDVFCRHAVETQPYTSIAIDKQFLAKLANEMGFEKDRNIVFTKVDNPCLPTVRQAIMNLQREISIFGGNLPLMLDSLTIQLGVLLLRETESNFDSKNAAKDNYNYVNKAIDFIQEYYNSNISLDDICHAIHITPYHFIRLFKEETGLTPHVYLLNVRIENAKKMLEKRECTITETAYLCGFSTVSHFSAAFKKQVGIAPLEYKKIYSV